VLNTKEVDGKGERICSSFACGLRPADDPILLAGLACLLACLWPWMMDGARQSEKATSPKKFVSSFQTNSLELTCSLSRPILLLV
jgi:hypothetical protein